MANNAANNCDRWYFTKDQLDNTPSRKAGYDQIKELSYRQQTANLIQDMGQRLKVAQLCINTAIVYMHRFYVFHSFTNFPWHQMAAAALFLAAKVEEQPRKLEYVIRVANICRNSKDQHIDVNSERYIQQSQDLVFNENVLLQTLGFDVAIDHPHTHVVRCCHLVRASKDLAQSSYFLASNRQTVARLLNFSLHLTTMCLQYKPTVVACFCIHLACKWSSWEIPLSSEKKEWFLYVDPTVTAELLRQLTVEFLSIFESCPSRLKEKIMAIGDNGMHNTANTIINSPFDTNPKKILPGDQKDPHAHRSHDKGSEEHKHRRPHESGLSSQQQREREYREKKEREKLAQQHGVKPSSSQTKLSSSSSHHHRPPVDAKLKVPSSSSLSSSQRLSSSGGAANSSYSSSSSSATNRSAEPRDILREASRDSPFGIATKDYNRESTHSDKQRVDQVRASSNSDNNNKEQQQQALKQRDYLLKANVIENSANNNLNNYSYNSGSRSVDPNKVPTTIIKQETIRRHDDTINSSSANKLFIKTEPDPTKKHYVHDKNSTYNKSSTSNSTSQKIKSPFTTATAEPSKSVPKVNTTSAANKHQYNGSAGGGQYNLSLLQHKNDVMLMEEPFEVPNLSSTSALTLPTVHTTTTTQAAAAAAAAATRIPSLFSPEKSPLSRKSSYSSIKLSPDSRKSDLILSPLTSPTATRRSRNYSSSSEPELRPVMKKIDQVEGFENLMRDSTIGINKLHQVPDIITPISDKETKELKVSFSKEMKPPDIIPPLANDVPLPVPVHSQYQQQQPIVNGMETNPMLISSLLKEAPSIPHLPVVANITDIKSEPPQQQSVEPVVKEKEKEHHHHKSKKKNKEKHKHKDKNKEDREKKKKHKDKDREKHKHKHESSSSSTSTTTTISTTATEPIKIKIQKDKIHSVPEPRPEPGGLKIKIPKDVIKTETILNSSVVAPQHHQQHHHHHHHQQTATPSIGLKIKIPKDVINANNESGGSSSSSRKRERDRNSQGDLPASKMSRSHKESSSSSSSSSKQNGRHSYNKVSNYQLQQQQQPISQQQPTSQNQQLANLAHYHSQMLPQAHQMYPPPPPHPPQNMYYYPQMAMPPPNMTIPPPPPPPPNFMYTQYYNAGYMYPDMYHQQQQAVALAGAGGGSGDGSNPPLPMDAPPDVPPPPPPE